MEKFNEFIEEWMSNCDVCPNCGSEYPIDNGGHYHGSDECPNSPDQYTKEVIKMFFQEQGE